MFCYDSIRQLLDTPSSLCVIVKHCITTREISLVTTNLPTSFVVVLLSSGAASEDKSKILHIRPDVEFILTADRPELNEVGTGEKGMARDCYLR